jgi:hypothetical protein
LSRVGLLACQGRIDSARYFEAIFGEPEGGH